MAYVYRYIDLNKEEVVYIGKVTKESDIGYDPLSNRDAQHRREEWYKNIGEENIVVQYIECSHVDADIFESWLIQYYGKTGQLMNISKTNWGKSNLDLYSCLFGHWRNFGQNNCDVHNEVHRLANTIIDQTETLQFHIDSALEYFCEGIKTLRKRLCTIEKLSRFHAQDDFMRGDPPVLREDNK